MLTWKKVTRGFFLLLILSMAVAIPIATLSSTQAATPFNLGNFESYTTGALSEQDNWSAPTGFQIENIGGEHNNALSYTGNQSDAYKTGSSLSEGSLSFSWMKEPNDHTWSWRNLQVGFFSGGSEITGLIFLGDTIKLMNSGGSFAVVIASGLQPNIWYEVDLEWQSNPSQMRARVDGGAWSAWVSTYGAFPTDKIRLRSDTGSAKGYYDNFADLLPEPTPTPIPPTPTPSSSNYVLEETFEGIYQDGCLSGQFGWTGSCDIQIQNGAVVIIDGSGDRKAHKLFTPKNQAVVTIYMMKTDTTTGDLTFQVGEETAAHLTVDYRAGQGFGRMVGGTFTPFVSSPENGVWYRVDIQYQSSPAKQQKLTVYKVTSESPWTEEQVFAGGWEEPHSLWTHYLNTVLFRGYQNLGPGGWYDSLTVEETFNQGTSPVEPVINSPVEGESLSASDGQDWSYQVDAEDPNGGQISYQALSMPSGMTLFPNGLFSWSASSNSPGNYSISFLVENETGLQTTRNFTLSVGGTTNPTPTPVPTPGATPTPTPTNQVLGVQYGSEPLALADPADPPPVISVETIEDVLKISTGIILSSYTAQTGETINGFFVLENTSSETLDLDTVILGGRKDEEYGCATPPPGTCPDFPAHTGTPPGSKITLAPGGTYLYSENFTFLEAGTYDFRVFVEIGDDNWYWNLSAEAVGTANQRFVTVTENTAISCVSNPIDGQFTVTQEFLEHPTASKGIDLFPLSSEAWFVHAPAGGEIVAFGNNSTGRTTVTTDPGNFVVIKHEPGLWNSAGGYAKPIIYTLYFHLEYVDSDIVAGKTQIQKGEPIGKIGNTGYTQGSTGNHLHFEIREDFQSFNQGAIVINPREYVHFGDELDLIPSCS